MHNAEIMLIFQLLKYAYIKLFNRFRLNLALNDYIDVW
jgi:hypothetical protein